MPDGLPLREILAALMFSAVIATVMLGYPVAFTLAGTGLIFAAIGVALDIMNANQLSALATRYYGVMVNEPLVAVPLFVFMGVMLERSRIAEALLTTMGQLFGSLRGGLGISVVLVGALLAASTGIVGATVVTMGLLSLPAMIRAGYDPRLASGVICASGTLGQIIPPSTVLIFLGDFLQSANAAAQLELGNFSPETLSVGQLFAGALIPGLALAFLYVLWVVIVAITSPSSAPALVMTQEERRGLAERVVKVLLPPLLLILAVLGSILTGLATPTESASVGAIGATLLAWFSRRLTVETVRAVAEETVKITALVFTILLGASVFSVVFRLLEGEALVTDLLSAVPGEKWGALFAVMLIMFVLGFFLDTFEIIFIMVPITAPALILLGIDPLWLGVMIGVNLQTSFLTPPFGFALFYLRGVASHLVSTLAIYRGAVPFIGLQVSMLIFLCLVPEAATWLPRLLFNDAAIAEQIREEGGGGDTGGFGDLFGGPRPAPAGTVPRDGSAPGGASQGGGPDTGGFGDLFGDAPRREPQPATPRNELDKLFE